MFSYFNSWCVQTFTHSSACKSRMEYEALPAARRENKSWIQNLLPKSYTPTIFRWWLTVIFISVLPGKFSSAAATHELPHPSEWL